MLQPFGADSRARLQRVDLVCPPYPPADTSGAITSRPMLLSGVARLTQYTGQCPLLATRSHVAGDQIEAMIANIRESLDQASATAPQLTKKAGGLHALVRYVVGKILSARPKARPPITLDHPCLDSAIGQQRNLG